MGWFDALADGAAKLGASVKQTAGNVAASAKATAQQVATTVKSAFDKTADAAGKTVDAAKQSLANAYDQAKATSSTAVKKVEDAATSAKEYFAPKPAAPVMACVASPGTPPARNDQPPCCVTGMTVKCSHGARQFTLSVPGPKQRDNRHVIQVLGTAQSPDELLVTLNGGPCAQGKPGGSGTGALVPDDHCATSWPSVSATGEKVSVRAVSPFKVKAYGPDALAFLSFGLFIKAMFDPKSIVRSTELAIISCNGGQDQDVLVEVYPPLGGNLSFSVSYGRKKEEDFQNGWKTVELWEGWTIAHSPIQLYCGSSKLDFFNIDHTSQDLFSGVCSVLGPVLSFVDEVSDTRVTYTPPSFQVVMDVAATEQYGDWQVKTTGSISVGFSPLFRASVTFDIFEQVLRIIGSGSSAVSGPVGPIMAEILIKARARARKAGAPIDVGIDFIVTGDISGGLKWILPNSAQGQLDGSVSFDLKGTCKAEFRKLLVPAGASAEIGMKTKLGARLGAAWRNQMGYNALLYFDGLKIYCVVDVHLGGGTTDAPPESKPSRIDETKVGPKYSDSWTLIDSASWPEKESFVDLSNDFF